MLTRFTRGIADTAPKRGVPQRGRHTLCSFGERPYVRCVDPAPHNGGRLGFVLRQARIVDPSLDLPEPVEMEEDERLLIDLDIVAMRRQRVSRQIPGGQVGALVLQDGDALKTLGPVVEILLICETPVFASVEAPLQAAFAPPAWAGQCLRRASEAQPSHVVDPELLQPY